MMGQPSRVDDDHFTLANIPFGVASTSIDPRPKIATRVYGDVFFIPDLISCGLLDSLPIATKDALFQPQLNSFACLPKDSHRAVRKQLQEVILTGQNDPNSRLVTCTRKCDEVMMHVPVHVGDFSDFSCSRDHVLNAGEAVMGTRQLPPGFLHFPVGYGGRCSSIVPSGSFIRRPKGQYRSGDQVRFGPSEAVDFELEVACVIGKPSQHGENVKIEDADDHIFGLVLLNDWSARDIQGLEMNPLGPFNGKSFGTTVSPWIVTLDALTPFETKPPKRDLQTAPYLTDNKELSQYSIQLSAEIVTGSSSTIVCQSRLEWLYWTFRDLVAHQTINGCPLKAGDILATGTVSGGDQGTHGCLLEITKGGKQNMTLSDGSHRTYLQDGDAVRLTGWAGQLGESNCVGFGESFGVIQGSV